jgi:hypothetical protein
MTPCSPTSSIGKLGTGETGVSPVFRKRKIGERPSLKKRGGDSSVEMIRRWLWLYFNDPASRTLQ